MAHERFHIDTKPAPPMFRLPNKFDVRAKRFRLAAMLVHEAVHYKFDRDVVLSRPCIYGVFGGRLGGFKPIKDRCVGCMRCVQEYPHIMTVCQSDEYMMLGNESWTPEAVFTVYYEASTGKIPVKGMGYKGSFGGTGWDGMWTDMSEIVRPTRDGVYGREYISTIVDMGRKPLFLDFSNLAKPAGNMRVVQSPLPIMFDEIPSKATNEIVNRVLYTTAKNLGIFHSSERPITQADASFIPILNNDTMDSFESNLAHSRIIEVEIGKDASETPLDRIRKDHPSALISARVLLDDDAEEKACRLIQTETVDLLHLCADYHGRDWSAKPRHVSEAMKQVHTKLVKERLRDLTTIILSGGITLAEHVPKAIICGADMVGLDTTLLVALQSEFKPTDDKEGFGLEPRRQMDAVWGTQRLVNLMASWHDQIIEILSAMGMRDIRRLRGDIGRSMSDDELREQAFQEIPKSAT